MCMLRSHQTNSTLQLLYFQHIHTQNTRIATQPNQDSTALLSTIQNTNCRAFNSFNYRFVVDTVIVIILEWHPSEAEEEMMRVTF